MLLILLPQLPPKIGLTRQAAQMAALKHLRTGKRAARARKTAVWARSLLCAILIPLLVLAFMMGLMSGLISPMLASLIGLALLALVLQMPLYEGRENIAILTLGDKGIQIEPAARPRQTGPLLFLWSEIEQIALVRPVRGRPSLKIVPSITAATAQGLRPVTRLPSILTGWTRPVVRIPTELFDCPESKLLDIIGAAAESGGHSVQVQNSLGGGLRLLLNTRDIETLTHDALPSA